MTETATPGYDYPPTTATSESTTFTTVTSPLESYSGELPSIGSSTLTVSTSVEVPTTVVTTPTEASTSTETPVYTESSTSGIVSTESVGATESVTESATATESTTEPSTTEAPPTSEAAAIPTGVINFGTLLGGAALAVMVHNL